MGRSYDLIKDYVNVDDANKAAVVNHAPACVLAVVRLALPLSYSRTKKSSVKTTLIEGAETRGKTLIITDDCRQLTIAGSKSSHTKALSAHIAQSNVNYLTEILPGDWILAWIVNSHDKAQTIVEWIKKGWPCNYFDTGFKFVGRVKSIRKRMQIDAGGTKTSSYQLQAQAFAELDSQLFYDINLNNAQLASGDLGTWLARVGLTIEDFFPASVKDGVQLDNVHLIIPQLVELFLGRGAGPDLNNAASAQGDDLQPAIGAGATKASVLPKEQQSSDGQTSSDKEAPFAYLVPESVGALLKKTSRSKHGGVLAYADIMELLYGLQNYEDNQAGDFSVFTPHIEQVKGNQRYTGTPLLGAYVPLMNSLCNVPIWEVLRQWLNPTVNELYTTLRVNADGYIVPTLVLRQIPFTTDAFPATEKTATTDNQPKNIESAQTINVTRFLSLPRWKLHGALVRSVDLGRSDATRCNFVHVYGQASYSAANRTLSQQLAENPPIRDDLDIQRSGLHMFSATVACAVVNEIDKVPSLWMSLVADRLMGSQYTLNGTIECFGIEQPICEGDNLEFGGVAYHIESYTHSYTIDASGNSNFSTSLALTNGMRIVDGQVDDTDLEHPIYPGMVKEDLRQLDPGLSIGYDDTTESSSPLEVQQSDSDIEQALDNYKKALAALNKGQ